MKPICVPCKRFFKPIQSGYYFLEGMPDHGAVPGNAEPEKWHPYKLWAGDLWECPDCHASLISGTGRDRIAEHYEANFAQQVEQLDAAQFQVNDC